MNIFSVLEYLSIASKLEGKHSGKDVKRKWKLSKSQALIYISQFLSSWGDRMWLFAGGLFLIEVTPESFRLVAIYEAALSLTVILFGAIVGRWIDRTSRIMAAQISLFIQNLMVCLCTSLLCLLIIYKEFFRSSLNGWGKPLTEAVVILMACVAQIGTLGIKLAIEKDWIVVICGKDDTKLSKMNGVLRSIDLSTEMMGPVLVGFVMTGSGIVYGGIFIAVWNVASFFVEYGTLHYLYKTFPLLQKHKVHQEEDGSKKKESIVEKLTKAAAVWKAYFGHKICKAGMSLAVLFVTVLALDNFSRAYVYQTGVSEGVLGILTACASFTGILGSIIYPVLRKKVGILRTGLIGFGSEALFLVLCVASIFAPGTLFRPSALWNPQAMEKSIAVVPLANISKVNRTVDNIFIEDNLDNSIYSLNENVTTSNSSTTSVNLLLSGIILSRFGLWVADLSVTQIMQEEVEEGQRGAINGVQFSLNMIFNLFRNIMLIILPSLETFGYLIMVSFFFVLLGFFLFLLYVRKNSERHLYEIKETHEIPEKYTAEPNL